MKNLIKIATSAAAVGIVLSASSAFACKATMKINNKSKVSINPISCATQKKGKSKWVTNVDCANFALMSRKDNVDPNTSSSWPVTTSRKKKTEFRIKLSYHYGVKGPVRSSYSNYAKCSGTHTITVN